MFLSIPEIEWMPLRSLKMSIANSPLMKDKNQRERTPGRPSTSRLEKDLSAKKKRGPASPIPNKSIRLDSFAHWPSYMCDEKHGRCKLPGCNKVTGVICSKCKVNLCYTAKANCFKISIHIDVTSFTRQFINRQSVMIWTADIIFCYF